MGISNRKETGINTIHVIAFLVLSLIYKIAMEYAYVFYLNYNNKSWYPTDINSLKCVYGTLWVIILFAGIPHFRKKVSTFLLEFFYIFQIIPIAVVYGVKNESTLYFTYICVAVFMCEIIVRKVQPISVRQFNMRINWWWIMGVGFLTFFIVYRLLKYGFPTLTAINIYDIYELRSSDVYQLSKYASYLQDTIIKVIIPIMLSKYLVEKHYIKAIIVLVLELILYLYAGEKSFLFIGVMVIGVVGWSMRKNFNKNFWACFLSASIVSCFAVNINSIIENIYSIIYRRVMIDSACNKFLYYDFFKTNPKEGWAGVFPRWLINVTSNYIDTHYSYLIAAKYHNRPEMQANTGFLAEGYLRWGVVGIFVVLIVFAFCLKAIDGLQERTNYSFALGVGVNFVFGLADGHLINTMIFGYNMVWLFFVLFYKSGASITIRKPSLTKIRLKYR